MMQSFTLVYVPVFMWVGLIFNVITLPLAYICARRLIDLATGKESGKVRDIFRVVGIFGWLTFTPLFAFSSPIPALFQWSVFPMLSWLLTEPFFYLFLLFQAA